MIKILLDVRERKVIDKLRLEFEKNGNKIDYEIEMLDLGDFVFMREDGSKVIVERKTWDDFSKSIVDGRYREQKIRYKSQPWQVIYLLEGDCKSVVKRKQDIIESCMLSMIIRDKISVIKTKNINDTTKWLIKMYNKLIKLGDISKEEPTYLDTLCVNKKDNLTPEICFQNQLRQIPGVSTKIAKIISKEYPNFPALISKYETLEEENRPALLKEINTGKRRLGKKLSAKIYNFIYVKKI